MTKDLCKVQNRNAATPKLSSNFGAGRLQSDFCDKVSGYGQREDTEQGRDTEKVNRVSQAKNF